MSIKILTNDDALRQQINIACADIVDTSDICIVDRRTHCAVRGCIALIDESVNEVLADCIYVATLPIKNETIYSIVKRVTTNEECDTTSVMLRDIFEEMGLKNCRKGTLYLIDAVRMYPMGRAKVSIKSILEEVAQKYSVTPSSVERAMRTAIEYLFRYGNRDKIYSVFGNTVDPDKGKPSNGEFISLMAVIVNEHEAQAFNT